MTVERTTNTRAAAVPDWSIVTTEAARTALKAAFDALDMGAMLGTDTNIRSACRHCGRTIEGATCGGGRVLGTVAPANALVWSDIHYHGCAAASLCTVQVFFCSEGHLDVWRDADRPGATGVRLSMEEALQVARAICEPMLTPGAMR